MKLKEIGNLVTERYDEITSRIQANWDDIRKTHYGSHSKFNDWHFDYDGDIIITSLAYDYSYEDDIILNADILESDQSLHEYLSILLDEKQKEQEEEDRIKNEKIKEEKMKNYLKLKEELGL